MKARDAVSDVEVGEIERREIQDQITRVLRDLGTPDPPLSLPDVRHLLKLDLRYYDGSDSGLIAELTHRVRLLTKKTLPDIGKHLVDALAKSKLVAFWVPDSKKVLIDSTVPEPKHRWIEGHETTHSLVPWHRDFLLGDNHQTLDPACRAILEAEANYGAGQLLFLQDRFAREARDLGATFNSIHSLAKRYGNTITSTLWRFVEDREAGSPVFGMISIHPHHTDIGAHDGPSPWRYFIRSAAFRTQFSTVSPQQAYELIERHANWRRTGPVLNIEDVLQDVNDELWEFRIESFSNSHALLTYGVVRRKAPTIVSA